MSGKNRKLVYGALVLGALGFGVTQAVASPRSAEASSVCTREQAAECRGTCAQLYGPFARFTCVNNGVYGMSCACSPPA